MFRLLAAVAAVTIVALLVAIGARLAVGSAPTFEQFGLGFLVESTWDVVNGVYGALPFIVFGAVIAGIVEEMIPPRLLARLIPRKRVLAIVNPSGASPEDYR